MRTIEIDMQPSMIMNLEEEARMEGVSPQILIVSILRDYFDRKSSAGNSLDARLAKLRGSLSPINTVDLAGDERAQKILMD